MRAETPAHQHRRSSRVFSQQTAAPSYAPADSSRLRKRRVWWTASPRLATAAKRPGRSPRGGRRAASRRVGDGVPDVHAPDAVHPCPWSNSLSLTEPASGGFNMGAVNVEYSADEALEALLKSIDRPGDFCAHGRLFAPMPRLEVEGVGLLFLSDSKGAGSRPDRGGGARTLRQGAGYAGRHIGPRLLADRSRARSSGRAARGRILSRRSSTRRRRVSAARAVGSTPASTSLLIYRNRRLLLPHTATPRRQTG